nr:hypothetical protein [Candidatus Sigynarchaeota archaeon]
ELLVYRELPFQDNQWMATMLVQSKGQLDMLPITINMEKDIFTQITSEIIMAPVVHDRARKRTTVLLHDWFYNRVIEPFSEFCTNVLCKEPTSITADTKAYFKRKITGITRDENLPDELANLSLSLFEF